MDRKRLADYMLKKSRVKPRANAEVTGIGKGYVVVNRKEKIEFRYLVGADGSASFVRRHLGLKMERFCLWMQYIIKGKKYHSIELFFDSSLFRNGYAWIFPHKGYSSIGCGAEPTAIKPDKLRRNFEKWLKQNNFNVSNARFEAFPINFDYRG